MFRAAEGIRGVLRSAIRQLTRCMMSLCLSLQGQAAMMRATPIAALRCQSIQSRMSLILLARLGPMSLVAHLELVRSRPTPLAYPVLPAVVAPSAVRVLFHETRRKMTPRCLQPKLRVEAAMIMLTTEMGRFALVSASWSDCIFVLTARRRLGPRLWLRV